MGLRRSRYIGEPRTHLQHVVIATAMNVRRVHDCWRVFLHISLLFRTSLVL